MMKKIPSIIILFATVTMFIACANTPAAPQFSTFANYPSANHTLVFFTTFDGQGVEYMNACIITNPSDLESAATLNYDNNNADSVLETWQNQYNAVTIASNLSVLRADVAMFDLPKNIQNVGILLVGGSAGKYHTVQYFVLEIDPETDRQGFAFTLNANSTEQDIDRLSAEELETRYSALRYKRYGWQKFKDQKPQVGFIVM
ncbi:MAG: hypothetical protein LBQ88_14695 [Treponema sp.]|jgi:hypothetical protein|nr:hypothetical protein [Treponema sp.]